MFVSAHSVRTSNGAAGAISTITVIASLLAVLLGYVFIFAPIGHTISCLVFAVWIRLRVWFNIFFRRSVFGGFIRSSVVRLTGCIKVGVAAVLEEAAAGVVASTELHESAFSP